ncbi:MAG: response regulator [Salinibacter sp.]
MRRGSRRPAVCRELLAVAVLLAVWIGGGPEVARADEVPYRQYTTVDGLPGDRIEALAQTPDGLLWVATQGGLAVFDGDEFRKIPLPDSIAAFSVNSLYPRPDGSVWAGTHVGPVLKVRPTGVERVLLTDTAALTQILFPGDAVVFVTTRAVWRLPPDAEQPTRQPFQYEMRPPTEAAGAPPHVGTGAWGAALGPDGTLWILDGRRGPGRVHPDGSVTFPNSPTVNARPGALWRVMSFTGNGTALITKGSSLYRFSPSTNELKLVLNDLSSSMMVLQGGIAYLTREHRVLRYEAASGDPLEPLPLPGVSPETVVRTQGEGLWVGTRSGLVHLMAPGGRHVKAIRGTAVQHVTDFSDAGAQLWVGTWGSGLLQIRPRRRQVTPRRHDKWVALRSRDGFLHAMPAGEEAWYKRKPQAGWQRLKADYDAIRGIVDSSGTGFFWHDDGVYRHSQTPGEPPTQLFSWPSDERGHYQLALGPNGDPILRAKGHLLRLRRTDGAVMDTLASFPEYARALGIFMRVGPEGRVWCAFESGGLLRVDPSEGESNVLLEERSLRNVRPVGDSLTLAYTRQGLYLLDAESGAVRRHLTQADGLFSNVINGAYLTSDTLYVTHPNALTLLPRKTLFRTLSSPPTLLTALEVNLEGRSLRTDSILGASERTIGVSYTAPELRYPDRVRYEIRLVPHDAGWQTTERDFARYTDLEPGTYRFEVRARLGTAPPGSKATYSFTIPPFFYETWWFWLLVALGLGGLGVGAWRWRTYRLRRRQEELETAVQSRTEELAAEKQKTEAQAERLAELDEAKNRFFAHISHEFRTPLSLILTPLEEALRDATTETIAFGTEQVKRMVRNAERLQRLIEQLLDLATLEAGRMELDRQPGDLGRVIRRTAKAFTSMAEREGIDLRVRAVGDRLQARFDPEKVESIVNNLLSNALKFTPSGGRVTVWIGERTTPRAAGDGAAREALLKVADTGPGMDAETQNQIFERFEHVDTSDTREHEGAGLGLALTHELVELHGGTIEVESTPERGTTFTVALPLVSAAEAATSGGTRGDGAWTRRSEGARGDGARGEGRGDALPAEPRAARGDSSEGRNEEASGDEEAGEETATVLVVEDNAEMRAYLRKQLSPHWQVQAVADGAEGWDAVQEEAPDLVLSDVMMPGLSGFDLCEKIKDDPDLRDIPVILLTARAEREDTIEGLEHGADDYVAKPFDVAELRRRIANHLTAREHLREQYRDEVHLGSLDTVVEEQHISFLETVTETVELHLSDPQFSVDRLAQAVALSRRQLTRRLKEAVGQTPAAFIRARRIGRAKQLLADDAQTVAEVARAVGFQSPSAFSKAFREQVGHPPSEHGERSSG